MSESKLKTKDEVAQMVEAALKLNDHYIASDPNEVRYRWVKEQLGRVKTLMQDHWPFTPAERKTFGLGLYAVRELEGVEDDLCEALIDINWEIDRGK